MGKDIENEPCRKEEDLDIMDIVGGNGPWQKTIFAVFLAVTIPNVWHNMTMSFIAPNIDHYCAKADEYANFSLNVTTQNTDTVSGSRQRSFQQCFTYEFEYDNLSIKLEDNSTEVPLLNITRNETTAYFWANKTVPCQKWVYDESEYTNTIVSQWNLVCTKEWMISFTKTVFMAGYLVSLLILGPLADKIGRKPVLMVSLIIFFVSATICAFSISFTMFAICRFFVAFGISGLSNASFVHLMEVISPESRSFYGIAIGLGWSVGYVILPAIAWMIREWNWLQLAITLPNIGLIIMWWCIPESPRWLLTQGKQKKAQQILCKAAKANGKNFQDVENALKRIWAKNQKAADEKTKSSNIRDLICTPGLWQRTMCMWYIWFVAAFVYYGLSYNTNDLAGNPFTNFAISGAVEIPSYIVTIFVIKSLGRRRPLMITLVIGGVSCLLILPLTGDLEWIRMPLAMFGKFCITASFVIVYVYAAEIFPTVMRNTGVGSCSVCARIGSMLAPFVKELGQATHPAVPLSSFGVLSIISALLVLLLPETNGCKVPDTFSEAAEFGRKKKQKVEEDEEAPKQCLIHGGSNDIIEKTKSKSASPPFKPVSDGKKLPDLIEEPSVIDEATDDDQDHPSITPSAAVDDLSNLISPDLPFQEAVELKKPDHTEKPDQNQPTDFDTTQQTPL